MRVERFSTLFFVGGIGRVEALGAFGALGALGVNAECRTDDKPRAEGKLACAMPRCEGRKAYEVGLMQNAECRIVFSP